jgi:hypothetical protein
MLQTQNWTNSDIGDHSPRRYDCLLSTTITAVAPQLKTAENKTHSLNEEHNGLIIPKIHLNIHKSQNLPSTRRVIVHYNPIQNETDQPTPEEILQGHTAIKVVNSMKLKFNKYIPFSNPDKMSHMDWVAYEKRRNDEMAFDEKCKLTWSDYTLLDQIDAHRRGVSLEAWMRVHKKYWDHFSRVCTLLWHSNHGCQLSSEEQGLLADYKKDPERERMLLTKGVDQAQLNVLFGKYHITTQEIFDIYFPEDLHGVAPQPQVNSISTNSFVSDVERAIIPLTVEALQHHNLDTRDLRAPQEDDANSDTSTILSNKSEKCQKFAVSFGGWISMRCNIHEDQSKFTSTRDLFSDYTLFCNKQIQSGNLKSQQVTTDIKIFSTMIKDEHEDRHRQRKINGKKMNGFYGITLR